MNERERRSVEPPDEVLAQRIQGGDRDALEQLVRRYVRAIHAVTAVYLSERADIEDTAQETFVRALERIASYDATRPFAPWLYEVARNVARDRGAANARRATEPLRTDVLKETAPGADVLLERAEIRRLVDAALGKLPDQQRTAFRLHDVEGYTTAEIAQIMGVTTGTIRSHIHHARRALREVLGSRLGERSTPEAGDARIC